MSVPLPPELLEQLGLHPHVPDPPLDGPYELPAPMLPVPGPYEVAHRTECDSQQSPEPRADPQRARP
jgi:hypothetical protein